MPRHIAQPQYRREREATKYPFADRATLVNRTGRMFLEGTLLDAVLFPVGGRERAYISQVVITHQDVTLMIGDSGTPTRCSGTCALLNAEATIALTDALGRPAGLLISESARLGIFQSWGVGTHLFTVDMTEFAAVCCIPTPEIGVRGFQLEDGTLRTGDVWLVGDDGIVFREEEITLAQGCGPGTPQRVIRVDAVGDPLFRRRLCAPIELFVTPRFITQVRVQHDLGEFTCSPDEFGDLKVFVNNALAVDSVLRVRPTAAGLTIELVGEAATG